MLETIKNPGDIKAIPVEKLGALAAEIRQRIIEVVSKTGGHLGSSLGAVELTVALHYCLDLPRDKIVWDVGHQSYAHKLLTGRNDVFPTLRQYKGLSGFPCKDESECDCFTTGHSSTAVSLALGLVAAGELLPSEKRSKVASVIGDGSLSGGLCFEGLNNAGHLKKDLLVVLNTNELSIAPNVGAISVYLNKLISLPVYNRFKRSLEQLVAQRLPRGSRILKIANKFEESLKGFFVPGMLFEELGFRYFGPFDGHNLELLVHNFKNILTLKGPLLVHVVTKKGKGYVPAESQPVRFHSASCFDIATGGPVSSATAQTKSYTEVFSAKLLELGRRNKGIVAITAAMAEGTGLDAFRDAYPERFFDVGIAEAHAVCFAAGLAKQGLRPVVAIYSTFLQRAYDQIIEAVALQGLPVVFAIDRAGIVGGDGATHQGIFDLAFLRTIPQMAIAAPKDAAELQEMLEFAVSLDGPIAIRYPKDCAPRTGEALRHSPIELGKAEVITEGKDAVIIAVGTMVAAGIAAAKLLADDGFSVGVVNARFVKPLDEALFKKIAGQDKHIFTVEEGIVAAGFGSAVSEVIDKPVTRIGLPQVFIPCGKREILLKHYGLDEAGIADTIKKKLKK
jgi:1-deoxy-D-xylulose-5-phosphate synthase